MSKIFFTLVSVVALAALVACGGSNSSPIPPNPSTGNDVGFSNSNLAGTYVFSGSGVNGNNNNFDVLGVFTADGNGKITSGHRNVYTDAGNATQNESITGTYSVNQDGRSQVILNGSSSGQAIYRFVMQSPSAASFFQFSSSTDGTGRIQLQSTVNPISPSTFVVRLDGEDNTSNKNVLSAVGGITISGTGITGTMDQNASGVLSAQQPTTGSLTTPDATGRGTLSLTFAGSTHNFVYYWVSANHLELASTDAFFLHGYADLQTSAAALSGDQVFSLSGFTSNGSVIETGRLTLGGGQVTNGVEDYMLGTNAGGTYFPAVAFTGTYGTTSNGRWTAQSGANASNLVGWQVSPQQSVILAWNPSSTLLETGTMRAQDTTVTTASITGNYAANLSGFTYNNGGGYVELDGSFLANNGTLSGTIDSQTPGFFNTDIASSGQYSIAGNGRSPNGNVAGVSVVIYTVDANTAYLISSDNTRMYQGKMLSQQP